MHIANVHAAARIFTALHWSPRREQAKTVKQEVAQGNLSAVKTRTNSLPKGLGPRAALASAQLNGLSPQARCDWVEESRIDAIMGSCSRSMTSWRSGCRCYVSFVGTHQVYFSSQHELLPCMLADTVNPGASHYFPPRLDVLLSWSTLFRSVGTFNNYLAYVKTACLVAGVSTEVRHCYLAVASSFMFEPWSGVQSPSYQKVQRIGSQGR